MGGIGGFVGGAGAGAGAGAAGGFDFMKFLGALGGGESKSSGPTSGLEMQQLIRLLRQLLQQQQMGPLGQAMMTPPASGQALQGAQPGVGFGGGLI